MTFEKAFITEGKSVEDRVKLSLMTLGLTGSAILASNLIGAGAGISIGVLGGGAIRNWIENNAHSFVSKSKFKKIWQKQDTKMSFEEWSKKFIDLNYDRIKEAIFQPNRMKKFVESGNYKLP